MSIGLYIGRFQPFHVGHADAIEQIIKYKDKSIKKLIIGIGSAQEELTFKNPFSYYERRSMLDQALSKYKIDYQIVPLPDFNSDQDWTNYIMNKIPKFDVLFSGNPQTEIGFLNQDITFVPLTISKIVKATNIRKKLLGYLDWQNDVPVSVVEFLEKIDAEKRLDLITLQEQKILCKTIDRSKVLVVEKLTNKDYLRKSKSQTTVSDLYSDRDNEHLSCREYLLENLKKYQINYTTIKDDKINKCDFTDYDIIISLGGDGTFLKACKKIKQQLIIGINSDPQNSVGKLTRYFKFDIPMLCQKIANKKIKYENWNRLCVKVNGLFLPYLAVNEVLVGKPHIYQTSKLEIISGNSQGYFIGNGVIIATTQGKSAFYKSAGGVAFEKPNFGYTLVLPFKTWGDIEKTKVMLPNSTLKLKPVREGHYIIFDCDPKRGIRVNMSDTIEIITSLDGLLKVVVE